MSNDLIINPVTGEAIDRTAATNDMAKAVSELATMRQLLDDYRHQLEVELAARMDSANTRSEVVGDWKITVNAPTTEVYPVHELQAQLQRLVDAGTLDPVVLERVVVTPEPKPVEPRVAKTEVNKLLRHPDPAVAAAVADVAVVAPARRTVKVEKA